MKDKVYLVMLYNAAEDNFDGICGAYSSRALAERSLEDRFFNGFIDATNVEGLYRNAEGDLLLIKEQDVTNEYNYRF